MVILTARVGMFMLGTSLVGNDKYYIVAYSKDDGFYYSLKLQLRSPRCTNVSGYKVHIPIDPTVFGGKKILYNISNLPRLTHHKGTLDEKLQETVQAQKKANKWYKNWTVSKREFTVIDDIFRIWLDATSHDDQQKGTSVDRPGLAHDLGNTFRNVCDVSGEGECGSTCSWSVTDRKCFSRTKEMVKREKENRHIVREGPSKGCEFIRGRNESIPNYACAQVGFLDQVLKNAVRDRETAHSALSGLGTSVYYLSSRVSGKGQLQPTSRRLAAAEFVRHKSVESVLSDTIRVLEQNRQHVISFLTSLVEYTADSVDEVDKLIYRGYDQEKVDIHIDMIHSIIFALFGFVDEVVSIHDADITEDEEVGDVVADIDAIVVHSLQTYSKKGSGPSFQDLLTYMSTYDGCLALREHLSELFGAIQEYLD